MFTLLFIEDDEAIRTALRLVLEDEGYEVAEASDGETGIKMFGQIDPDLVLLDLRLPDISGFEVCRAIQNSQHVFAQRCVERKRSSHLCRVQNR